jgi:response regulator of citrate/malate metabolism
MGDQVLYCLAVDDEPLALTILERYISTSKGLNLVAKCETLDEAFTVLSTQHVDVIFLDLNLSDGYGLELVDRVNVETNDRYYIIITSALAKNPGNFRETFTSARVTLVDVLTKPFSYDRFQEVIKKVLNLKDRDDDEAR